MSKARPKIIHLRGSDFFGSPERLIIGQIRHLDGFDAVTCSFVKPDTNNPFLDRLAEEGLAFEPVEDNHLFDPAIPGRLQRIIERQGADILVTHEYKSNFYGHRAARRLKIPQVAYFHGWTAENVKVKFYNWLDRRVLPSLDRIITVSCATRSRLEAAGIPVEKIEVVYNAIDLEHESPPQPKPKSDTTVIGMLGRLSHEKGTHVLLEAIAMIKDRAPKFRVEIYGYGPDEERLTKMATELNLSEQVQFKGFRDDPENVYPTLDFLVLPSLSEGHPVVILEAWKQGVPVVATRAGGIPEVIDDGVSGLLTDIDDPQGLADIILKGLENPEMMRAFGKRGFELVKTKYNYQNQAERLAEIYRDVLKRRS